MLTDTRLPKKKETPRRTEAEWGELAAQAYSHRNGPEIRERLAQELGVTVGALERLHVGWTWDAFRGLECSTWPEKRAGNKIVGIATRYFRAVTDTGGKKLALPGSRRGLYLPDGWTEGVGPVLLPEGGSDTAALIGIGLNAIGRPSNQHGVELLIGVLAKCQEAVIVIGERDEKPERRGTVKQCPAICKGCLWCWPGRAGAILTSARLREAIPGVRVMWRMIQGAKDAREFIQSHPGTTPGKLLASLRTI